MQANKPGLFKLRLGVVKRNDDAIANREKDHDFFEKKDLRSKRELFLPRWAPRPHP
jgi:hypothetical protein